MRQRMRRKVKDVRNKTFMLWGEGLHRNQKNLRVTVQMAEDAIALREEIRSLMVNTGNGDFNLKEQKFLDMIYDIFVDVVGSIGRARLQRQKVTWAMVDDLWTIRKMLSELDAGKFPAFSKY